MSLQQKRKLKVKDDQKRAQSAIRSRRKQMMQETDLVESVLEEGEGFLKKFRHVPENIVSSKATIDYSEGIFISIFPS